MPIPVIDVFAGPGGLNEGFSTVVDARGRRVFKTALSVEMDEFAHHTLELRALFRGLDGGKPSADYLAYVRGEISRDTLFDRAAGAAMEARNEALRATMGESSSVDLEIEERIRRALKDAGGGEFVLIGGPPCQAYSLVGRARRRNETRDHFEADPKQRLYREYLRIVTRFKPAVFLMENVPGLLSAQLSGESTFALICADLSAAGYDLFPLTEGSSEVTETDPKRFVVRAEEYGVPQCRARVFILGLRKGLGLKPATLAKPTCSVVSIDDVIGTLPRIRSKLSRGPDDRERWQKEIQTLAEYKWHTLPPETVRLIRLHLATVDASLPVGARFIESDTKPKRLAEWYRTKDFGVIVNHNSRGHMASDLRRYFYWAAYASALERSPSLAEVPHYLRPNHENVTGDATELPFADRFRVQVAGKPSTTITSHIAKDGHYYIHFDSSQCRSLSVREAARLQTFPDPYFFEGPVTEQYKQVGNAVPPYLAHQIGVKIAGILS